MKIHFHDAKRNTTLEERGLDFADVALIFAGPTLTIVDDRLDYREERLQTYGLLKDRLVVVVWTRRQDVHHVISMRYCNDRERKKFQKQLR